MPESRLAKARAGYADYVYWPGQTDAWELGRKARRAFDAVKAALCAHDTPTGLAALRVIEEVIWVLDEKIASLGNNILD